MPFGACRFESCPLRHLFCVLIISTIPIFFITCYDRFMSLKTGYILLYAGVIIIIFAAFNTVMVLLKKAEPVQFYEPGDISIDFSQFIPEYEIPGLPESLQPRQQEGNTETTSNVLTESLNLLIHLFLMGLLINVGSKIAMIGTALVRPIVVKLHKTEQVISPKPTAASTKPLS